MTKLLPLALLLFVLFFGCSTDDTEEQKPRIPTVEEPTTGSFEYSGKTYKTVKIGTQWWMAENLNHNTSNSIFSRSLSTPD